MAAIACPAVNMNGSTSNVNGASTSNYNVSNGGRSAVLKSSAVGPSYSGLRHNVGLSKVWTRNEQSLLEELLVKYASDYRELRYGKIANHLQGKTIRDVVLMCQWMTKNENGKRRKDDNGSSRKQKDKREKIAKQEAKPSSHATNHANGLPYAPPSASMNIDDVISYKVIGGMLGMLLEQNAKSLDQISANLSAFKVHDNITLFCQTRDNIITILNNLNEKSEVMKQMPPLPVKLNMELTNSILPY